MNVYLILLEPITVVVVVVVAIVVIFVACQLDS